MISSKQIVCTLFEKWIISKTLGDVSALVFVFVQAQRRISVCFMALNNSDSFIHSCWANTPISASKMYKPLAVREVFLDCYEELVIEHLKKISLPGK